MATAVRDEFVSEMVVHIGQYSPRHARITTEGRLREAVNIGVAQAERHGFSQRGTVRFFLELMVLFGSGFDTDPQFSWAAEILGRVDYRTPMDRAEALHARLLVYLEQVGDERHDERATAFRQLMKAAEDFRRLASGSPQSETIDALRRIYPRKAAASGDGALETLVNEAVRRSREAGFGERQRILATAGMMFVFGHQFDSDPFLPWFTAASKRAGAVDWTDITTWFSEGVA